VPSISAHRELALRLIAVFVRLACALWLAASVAAQSPSSVAGVVRDASGGVLPGVSVQIRSGTSVGNTVTDEFGAYRFDAVAPGTAELSFVLINFSAVRRHIDVPPEGMARADAVLYVTLYADVTVTGRQTFSNLADVTAPAENLVGVAQSASQGAVVARQIETRPIERAGEVLETVPGMIISQHSGEGKANQYYLRGFNLDHGTDFATTVAGVPVNMPTNAHGHGYSDLNFVIPELVSSVQYSKGPYFAEQGDFSSAGSATINYTNALDRPIIRVGGGDEGFGRALVAASHKVGPGHLLGAIEIEHNDGPWVTPDNYRKINAVARYSSGDALNAFAITGMAYRAEWNSTDQIPERAVAEGVIGRFGALDPTDGGDTYRYSGTFEWQRSHNNAVTRVSAYGIGYDLDLYSNFTFFLDDPVRGDQFHQADHRFVSGAKASHRRLTRWHGRLVQNTLGVQVRNDDITNVGLYHTEARALLGTVRQDSVVQTSLGGYAQNETEWTPHLRTLAGIRVDGYRFSVDANNPLNGGVVTSGITSPKGGVVVGPFKGTEFYANAGFGFHSNDARGATIAVDPVSGAPVEPVTPLVRAKGAEAGIRTVAVPHLQSTLALWSLRFDSELVFAGDAGTTEAGRPSHRYGVEWANYYSPRPWLILDGDVAVSRAHFTDADPVGNQIPGSVESVVSAGIAVDSLHHIFGSVRLRYFGPRPLIEDNSVRSEATSLVNIQGGYRLAKNVRIAADVFNLFDSPGSDIAYYYASRLPGEPAGGVNDIHFHPALPRTIRIHLVVGF
jgi:outer membrane receptor protein involved in Fe transport